MKNRIIGTGYVLALCGLLGAGGCAGKDAAVVKEQIADTEKSIGKARDSNASINAPIELKMAESKLAAAKEAMEKKQYELAGLLVEKAKVDSDYALAKTNSAKARQDIQEMRDSIDALGKEIERFQRTQ